MAKNRNKNKNKSKKQDTKTANAPKKDPKATKNDPNAKKPKTKKILYPRTYQGLSHPEPNWKRSWILRVAFNATILAILVYDLHLINLNERALFIKEMGNWGVVFTAWTYAMLTFITLFRLSSESDAFHKLAKPVHHMSIVFAWTSSIYFWTMLAPNEQDRLAEIKQESKRRFQEWHVYFKHIFVPIVILVPVVFNRTDFRHRNIGIVIMCVLFYLWINCNLADALQKPIYPGVDWNSQESHGIVVSWLVTAGTVYYYSWRLSRLVEKKYTVVEEVEVEEKKKKGEDKKKDEKGGEGKEKGAEKDGKLKKE